MHIHDVVTMSSLFFNFMLYIEILFQGIILLHIRT